MNKKVVKLTSALMVFPMAATMFIACDRGGNESGSTHTPVEGAVNIDVLTFEGGVGTDWLDNAIERFEALYENKEWASGLKGINVIPKADNKSGADVLSQIRNDKYEVYFTEEVYYNDFVSANVLADITDVVTGDLSAYGEDKSIEDKMNDNLKNYLMVNEKYYAVPFWEGYSVLAYDVDLFEAKGFYYKNDGTFVAPNSFTNGKYTGAGTLSNGPDGKSGTADDGLPATYSEFFALCDYMYKNCSVTPMIWPGAHQDYMNEFANQLWADYEGYERMLMNYTFTGTDDSLVDTVSDSGEITYKEPTDISSDYTLLNRQAGKYYALSFIEGIMDNLSSYAPQNIMSGSMSHIDCADYFLKGKYYSQLDTIAMMVNGCWWQNEAKDTFQELELSVGEQASMENRRIGILPLPKATTNNPGGMTVQVQKSAFAFVNGNITDSEVLEAAKMFLQFCCTNASLVDFQRISGLSWALDYTMTAEELAECTHYAQATYNIHQTASRVYPYSKHEKYISKTSIIMSNKTPWTTSFDSKTYNMPTTAFYNNSGLTAKKYFEGLEVLF